MCLGIPMRIASIDGSTAVAETDGVRRNVSLLLTGEEVQAGDFVIVHAGFAIARLDEAEAQKTLALMRQAGIPEEMV